MKRMCPLLLAVLAVLSLCACGEQLQALPEVPSSGSVSPPPELSEPESIPPEPEGVPEGISVPEVPIPSEEPEPAPEEPPEPKLVAFPGVEVRTLLTWNREEKEIALGPCFWGKKQIVYETEGTARRALGLDLETGNIDFTISLPEDHYLREVLGEPGRFLVMGKTGCRNYIWREDGWLGRYPDYILPEQARKAMEYYDLQYCHFLWDYLPEENLLAWTADDGMWVSDLDGGDARLVIRTAEIFADEMFDRVVEPQVFQRKPNTKDGPLFVEPQLMDNGRFLAAGAYIYSTWCSTGIIQELVVNDLSTGQTVCYQELNGSIDFLDTKTVKSNNLKLTVASGDIQPYITQDWYGPPKWYGSSADTVHFFEAGYDGEQELCYLIRYTLDEEDRYHDPHQMYQDGKAETLVFLENSYFPYEVPFRPLSDRQVLCVSFTPAESIPQEASLLLVTAPETAQ